MLAHEIRTPLNGILAMSELIAAADLPERERQWAGHVKGAAEHLAALATLVVDGVRAEKRGLVLRDEPFRPRALAQELGATLRRARRRRDSPPMCRSRSMCRSSWLGDRVRLRAALENLIDNAVKFTERGRVALSVSAARRTARAASTQLRGDGQRHRPHARLKSRGCSGRSPRRMPTSRAGSAARGSGSPSRGASPGRWAAISR